MPIPATVMSHVKFTRLHKLLVEIYHASAFTNNLLFRVTANVSPNTWITTLVENPLQKTLSCQWPPSKFLLTQGILANKLASGMHKLFKDHSLAHAPIVDVASKYLTGLFEA